MGGRKQSPDEELTLAIGETFEMIVDPAPSYAGAIGSRAVLENLSGDAAYVVFETGLRESFPFGRFIEYFRRLTPDLGTTARVDLPPLLPARREPSGRIIVPPTNR